MTDERDEEKTPSLEERATRAGTRPGDRYVRIVRPAGGEFRHHGGHYLATDRVLEPQGRVAGAYERIRRVLIGRRISTEAEVTERVSKKTGLAILA